MIAIDDGEGTTIFRETVLVAQLETMVISSIAHCVVDTVATTLAHVLTESSMVTGFRTFFFFVFFLFFFLYFFFFNDCCGVFIVVGDVCSTETSVVFGVCSLNCSGYVSSFGGFVCDLFFCGYVCGVILGYICAIFFGVDTSLL